MPKRLAFVSVLALAAPAAAAPPVAPAPCTAAIVAKHGAGERARAERGAAQVARLWKASDGDAKALGAFCAEYFAPTGPALDALFGRFESALESLDGHSLEIHRDWGRWATLDLGPQQPVDGILDGYDPGAHQSDDLFDNKLAFVALLNFPVRTLEAELADGERWSRREWAEARLANRFTRRVPGAVFLAEAAAYSAAEIYVAADNFYVHHLVGDGGERLFPKGKRLLSHWNLRDELKAQYAQKDGLPRQRALSQLMQRIVLQTVPLAVIDSPAVDWNPFSPSGDVKPAPADTVEPGGKPAPSPLTAAREPDTRYARILDVYRSMRGEDPYSPFAPTRVARKFQLDEEVPEARVVALFEEVLGAPEVPKVAALISSRLGRPLEPFDLWYDGFKARAAHGEAELDQLTRARFPSAAAFAEKLPDTLGKLGFAPERAAFLAAHIEVDPARGSGHALEALRRGDKPHLRTRIAAGGMDYKGYNIAIHELGHNVEQVFGLYGVDSTLMQGVPNAALTEAIAFVFQARDLEVLGLAGRDDEARRLLALDNFWGTFETAGIALTDLRMWQWMYAHPRATPAELREATVAIARELWNRYYAPVLGGRDVPLLAVYSHLINNGLYLPEYFLGHLALAQMEEKLATLPAAGLGAELERWTTQGRLTPDLWMKNATGAPLGTAALRRAAAAALAR
jgi:hypothetical protein